MTASASLSKRLLSRMLENSPKPSGTLATMKLYKKMTLINQYLRKVVSRYFDILIAVKVNESVYIA